MGQSQLGARMVFLNAKDALKQLNIDTTDAILSQSYLQFETLLSTNQTSFQFGVLTNQTPNGVPVRPTERRLTLQDAFYASEIQVLLAAATSATDSAFQIETYPNPIIFPVGGAAPAPLEVLYNGSLLISVNNKVIMPGLDIDRFYNAPQTQNTAAGLTIVDERDGSQGTALEPNIVFIGQKNTQVVINLPQAISAVDDFTYAIIRVRGVLAQNVTVVS